MKVTYSLSLQTARHLHLTAQGLLRPLGVRPCFVDIHTCLRQMSLLQIDTINVVARSRYLVLFSRPGCLSDIVAGRDRSLPVRYLSTGRMKPALFYLKTIRCCAIACWPPAAGLEIQCAVG